MQNYSELNFIHQTKVINIKSELLCREAEDDFFYFNKINSAYKKLMHAINLTPNHLKSIMLLADISFIKGKIQKSLDLFLNANKLLPKNQKITGSIANCYYILGDYKNALEFCEISLNDTRNDNMELFLQVFEIKINVLMKQKNYKKAYSEFINYKNIINTQSFDAIYNINYKILSEKLLLQRKLEKINLKIV
jgi:tetratricopeptide (TPR) repeat protein